MTTQPTSGLSSSFTENISESSSSEKEINKSNDLTEIGDILLFIKEEEILEQLMEDKQSVFGCNSCMIDRLKKIYQEAREKFISYPQSLRMDNETVEMWFKNFEERYKDKISIFPLRYELFEESIDKQQSILTFEEELSLLKDVQKNSIKADCICQECILSEVSFLAYKLASDKNIPYPKSWKWQKKAESRWLKNFKVRHKTFFSLFPIICKITSSQSSTKELPSSFMENESSNNSQEEIKKKIVFIQIKNLLLFTKEEQILKQMMEDKQSVCGCKCCLMNCFEKVYQEARENLILYPQSSNMDKNAVEMWFKNFEDRHKNEISKLPSRCKISEEAITQQQSILSVKEELSLLTQIKANSTTKYCICQECLLREVSFLAYKVTSDNNMPYPESWEKHKKVEPQWLKDFTERHKNEISKFPLICKLISKDTIKALNLGSKSEIIFTFVQERSLLVNLEANSTKEDCICQKCVLEKLPFLIYELAYNENLKNKTKKYPKSWNKYKKAGYDWIENFIKRHEKEFAKLSFPCKINSSDPSTSKGQISLN